MKNFWKKKKLFEPVNGLSLSVFRIMFGFLICYSAFEYALYPDQLYYRYYSSQVFFKFQFFEWIELWPDLWMAKLHYLIMGIAALGVMFGFFYRFSIVIFTLLFIYVFLVSKINYLNHYYLVIIISFLMCFLPANKCLSVDRLIRTDWKNDTVPKWTVWSMRSLIEIVLLYAGIAKLNWDWLQLEPLASWLRQAADSHVFGNLVYNDWFIALGAYGSIAIHLIGSPFLFFKRTRIWIFIAYCIFHIMNAYTFNIGIFPYLTIAATLIFFEPDWPKTFYERIRKPLARVKVFLARLATCHVIQNAALREKISFSIVAAFLVIQVVLPLRHFLYPGNVSWTEEGHNFSWHMKLRDKNGVLIAYHVRDPISKKTWLVNPHDYLNDRQSITFRGRPDMLLQFAYYLEEVWRNKGYKDVEVYCESYVSLNGRRPALIVDPKVDLTTKKWDISPADWILPLDEPRVHWKDRWWEAKGNYDPASKE